MDTKVKTALTIGGSFVGGLAVGGFVGYIATRRHAADFFAEVTRQELEAMKGYYEEQLEAHKNIGLEPDPGLDDAEIQDDSDPNQNYDIYLDIMTHAGYAGDADDVRQMFEEQVPIKTALDKLVFQRDDEIIVEAKVEVEEEPKRTNIFDDQPVLDDDMIEYAEYMEARDEKTPYVIHVNDFMDTEVAPYAAYNKIPLNYYEGDNVLTDENNVPIADVIRLIGPDAVTMFGKFSGDNAIVYVRNSREDVESDFEVHRKDDSFASHVLGQRNNSNQFNMKGTD